MVDNTDDFCEFKITDEELQYNLEQLDRFKVYINILNKL